MLLAIDTSTRYAGVSLWDGDRAIAALCWHSSHNHTSELMAAIVQILGRAEAGPTDLEGIAVALGPGGFSALRVGLSCAKGLAMPTNTPIIGVGTLEMEAYPYASTGLPICSMLDAGRGEVASAIFQESEGQWGKLVEEKVCTPEELVGSISETTLFCGEGVPQRSSYLRQALGSRGVVVGFHTPATRLWSLGVLAGQRLERGDVDSMATLQPLYLRRPNIGTPNPPQRISQ